MEKYFPNPEQEAEMLDQETAQQAVAIDKLREFFGTAYMAEFRQWLAVTMKQSQPKVGAETDMIHRIGIRDGLQMVDDYLTRLERESRERSEDV